MKKGFLFAMLLLGGFSCMKSTSPDTSNFMPAPGTHIVTGTLWWSDPASDGAGLFFAVDNGGNLLFKNEFSDYYVQYVHYKDMVQVHARLVYTATGDSSCTFSDIPNSCATHQIPIVEVQSLQPQ